MAMSRNLTSLTSLALVFFMTACGTDDGGANEPVVPGAPSSGVGPVATVGPTSVRPRGTPTGAPAVNPDVSPVPPTASANPQGSPASGAPQVTPVDPAPVTPDVNPSTTA